MNILNIVSNLFFLKISASLLLLIFYLLFFYFNENQNFNLKLNIQNVKFEKCGVQNFMSNDLHLNGDLDSS